MNYKSINEVPANKLFIVHGYEKVLNTKNFYYLNGTKYHLVDSDNENGYYEDGRRYTICAILDKEKLYLGIAVCNKSDKFKRNIGIDIAFNKALTCSWSIDIFTKNPREIRNYINAMIKFLVEKNIDCYKNFFSKKEVVKYDVPF